MGWGGLTVTDEVGYVFRGSFFKIIYANYKIKLHTIYSTFSPKS